MTLRCCDDVFGKVIINGVTFFYGAEERELKIVHADRFEVRAWLHWFSTLKYGKIERNRSCQGNFKPPGHVVFAKAHFSAFFSCTCVRRSYGGIELLPERTLVRHLLSVRMKFRSREKLKKKKNYFK